MTEAYADGSARLIYTVNMSNAKNKSPIPGGFFFVQMWAQILSGQAAKHLCTFRYTTTDTVIDAV